MMTRWYFWRAAVLLLGMIVLLVAWTDITGNTINPRYVARIKDGQTTKNEIMLLFGEPQEVQRLDNVVTFIYRSYKDATPPTMKPPEDKEIPDQSTTPYFLDEEHNIKKVKTKKDYKELRSTLSIQFKPDGQTVLNHEYQEFKGEGGKKQGK